MSKLKDILGLTTYWVYGGGNGHYNISSTDKFKFHRAFVGNYVVTQGNLDLHVEPTWQNFKYDTYLKQLKDAGITTIWSPQGKFDFQDTIGKQGKVCPINEGDDPLKQDSWKVYGELCRQIAIRYADDTAQYLSEAKVFQGTPAYLSNTPKAGLGLLDFFTGLNEINFKHGWSGATRTMTREMAAVCFKVQYDAVRSVSKTLKLVIPSSIEPTEAWLRGFLEKFKSLYAEEGKLMPTDFYLDFHWYMRNATTDQSGGTAGETPETVGAYAHGQMMDSLCEEYGLLGWICTETGWATDTSKQSAPILEGYTREESQGILMIRLALIWGACKYCKGISFWHCRDDYDLPPYAKGGINYKNWSAKPARTICENFLESFGNFDVFEYQENNGIHSVLINNGNYEYLAWTDKKNIETQVAKFTTFPQIHKDLIKPMELKIENKKLNVFLTHFDSPESRLLNGYEAAFSQEIKDLAPYGNCLTATLRGDDVAVNPWINNQVSQGVDFAKLRKWKGQLLEWITERRKYVDDPVLILYLGERTNWNSLTDAQYFAFIDAIATVFKEGTDITGNCIFGWEEIGQNSTGAQVAAFVNKMVARIKAGMPKSLVMIHNNPGQKHWRTPMAADIICLQETTLANFEASAKDAYDRGYAVHLHEWYNPISSGALTQAKKDVIIDYVATARAYTSGYGLYIQGYDTVKPSNVNLDTQKFFSEAINGTVVIVYGCTDPKAINCNPNATKDDGSCIYEPQQNNGMLKFSTSPNPFPNAKPLSGAVIPSGTKVYVYWDYAGQPAPKTPLTFQPSGQKENGAPFEYKGGTAVTFPDGQVSVHVTDGNNVVMETAIFTVGTTTPPPVQDSPVTTIVLKANGSLYFTAQDGRNKTVA